MSGSPSGAVVGPGVVVVVGPVVVVVVTVTLGGQRRMLTMRMGLVTSEGACVMW